MPERTRCGGYTAEHKPCKKQSPEGWPTGTPWFCRYHEAQPQTLVQASQRKVPMRRRRRW